MRAFVGVAVSLGVGLVATAGCSRHAHQSPRHRTAASVVADNSRTSRSAVSSIVAARCEREVRCKNIGPDAKYPSKQACLEQVRADWSEQLNARECPGGVHEEELNECLADIRGEECGSPLDSFARMLSCGTAELCRDET